jgi:very-short-patch-repair endonuclease
MAPLWPTPQTPTTVRGAITPMAAAPILEICALTSGFRRQVTRFPPIERCIRLAALQFGMLARGQALALGMSDSAIQRRVASGAWEVIYPGVYRIAGCPDSWESRAMGAALACGPESVLFRRAAAALWNIDGSRRGVIELISTHRPCDGFRTHRRSTLDPDDRCFRGRFPVTTVPRTLMDLGSVYPASRCEEFLDAVVRQGLGSLEEVSDCFERLACRGRNGIANWRAVLTERDPTLGVPDSNVETSFAQMARRFHLPRYESQFHVLRPSGKDAYFDFAYEEATVGIEVDSLRFHSDPSARERDYEREAELVAMGWTILRFTSRLIRRQPGWAARQILATLEICSSASGNRR